MDIALTAKRKLYCMESIFPEEYFDIPGVECFGDFEAVSAYTVNQMKSYAGQEMDVYLNGGMSVEILTVIQAAAALNISIRVMHYDNTGECYIPHPVKWKPAQKPETENLELFCFWQGRHMMPGKPLFDKTEISQEKMFDFGWQEKQIRERLKEISGKGIGIYLSGLSQVFISALNAAYELNLPITFFHYNCDTEKYVPQNMDIPVI